mgnify:CR=1 FL=1
MWHAIFDPFLRLRQIKADALAFTHTIGLVPWLALMKVSMPGRVVSPRGWTGWMFVEYTPW